MKKSYSRRKFIKQTIGAGVVIAGADLALLQTSCSGSRNKYDPKGLPTTVLGKTGVVIQDCHWSGVKISDDQNPRRGHCHV